MVLQVQPKTKKGPRMGALTPEINEEPGTRR
jgi:hypothetical protein